MKQILKTSIILIFLNLIFTIEALSSENKKCLVAIHGLARTSNSLNKVEKKFKKIGFIVWNESYPSTEKKVEDLSNVVGRGLDFCKSQNAESIYFITHSMGGILVRHYFQDKMNDPLIIKIKAVVMLSPPNHGSEIVDAFKSQSWFKWFNGPAGLQMGTEITSLPNSLKSIPLNIGVITGNVSSDPWFSYLFGGPNDGKVSVESAKLKEMKDFLVVPRGHTFIMDSDDVIKNIVYFFEHSVFIK